MAHLQRSFTARDLVTLPRLTAPDALSLVASLTAAHDAAAADVGVAADLTARLDDLKTEGSNLSTALNASRAPATDSERELAADRRIDAAWSATRDWLHGWCKLPPASIPEGPDAYALYTTLFDQGLSFIQLEYRTEWSESELRLKAVADGGYAKVFAALGGKAFLQELTDAHAAYGIALGITAAPAPSSAGSETSVREALTSTIDSIRGYVAGVAGSVTKKVAATQTLADRLLLPLTTWVTKPGTPGTPAAANGSPGSTPPKGSASAPPPAPTDVVPTTPAK